MSKVQPSDFKDVTVQLEDGTVETFKIDPRMDASRLPQVLEGAVRARQRQKAGLPPPAPPELPSIFPSSISENVRRFAGGAASIPAGLAKNFIEGAQIINKDPVGALGLLPEAIQAPIRAAKAGMARYKASSGMGSGGGAAGLAMPLPMPLGIGQQAEVVDAVPVIGPMATSAGEAAAAGQGPEALGGVAANVALAAIAGKYGGSAMKRVFGNKAAPAAAAETPVPRPVEPVIEPTGRQVPLSNADFQGQQSYPYLDGGNKSSIAATTNSILGKDITPEMVDNLRQQLAATQTPAAPGAAAATKPVSIRLPIKIAGQHVPISIELNGPKIAAARAFLSTVKGSAAENAWAQRLLSGAVPDKDNKEGL